MKVDQAAAAAALAATLSFITTLTSFVSRRFELRRKRRDDQALVAQIKKDAETALAEQTNKLAAERERAAEELDRQRQEDIKRLARETAGFAEQVKEAAAHVAAAQALQGEKQLDEIGKVHKLADGSLSAAREDLKKAVEVITKLQARVDRSNALIASLLPADQRVKFLTDMADANGTDEGKK